MTPTLKFHELGPDYQRKFLEHGRYLIERGYIENQDLYNLAEKIYDQFIIRKEEEFNKNKLTKDES